MHGISFNFVNSSTEKHEIIRPEIAGVQEGRKTVADPYFESNMAIWAPKDAHFQAVYAH